MEARHLVLEPVLPSLHALGLFWRAEASPLPCLPRCACRLTLSGPRAPMLRIAYGSAARRITPALVRRTGVLGRPRAATFPHRRSLGTRTPLASSGQKGGDSAEPWRAVNSPDILCPLRVSDSSAAEAEASQRRGQRDTTPVAECNTRRPSRPADSVLAMQQVQRLASRDAEMWSCGPGVSSCVPRTEAQLHVPGPFLPLLLESSQRARWLARGRTGDARVGRGEHMPEPRAADAGSAAIGGCAEAKEG